MSCVHPYAASKEIMVGIVKLEVKPGIAVVEIEPTGENNMKPKN